MLLKIFLTCHTKPSGILRNATPGSSRVNDFTDKHSKNWPKAMGKIREKKLHLYLCIFIPLWESYAPCYYSSQGIEVYQMMLAIAISATCDLKIKFCLEKDAWKNVKQ